jgi:hypothetical protein
MTFDAGSRRDAVAYLMEGRINQKEQKSAYMKIAHALWKSLNCVGLQSYAYGVAHTYYILQKYMVCA